VILRLSPDVVIDVLRQAQALQCKICITLLIHSDAAPVVRDLTKNIDLCHVFLSPLDWRV